MEALFVILEERNIWNWGGYVISQQDIMKVQQQMNREVSKLVNIVLVDSQQVAGEISEATDDEIRLSDGRTYRYETIREINGL